MPDILVALGALHGELMPREYAAFYDGDGVVFLRARDDAAAIEAMLLTTPADELRVVPELAAAAKARGVGEVPWTEDVRARARVALLRRESLTTFTGVLQGESIAMLVQHAAALEAALGTQSAIWRGRLECRGALFEIVFGTECVVRLEAMPEVPSFDLKVFMNLEEAMAFEHLRVTEPEEVFDVPHLSVWTLPISDALAALGGTIAPEPKAWVGGEPRPVTDLECQWLAVVVGALATAVGDADPTAREHAFEVDGPDAHFATKLVVTSREPS